MEVRLQKQMADLGICSRRKAEILIAEGKVKVNGKIIKKLGTKVNSEKDKIEVIDTKIKTNVDNKTKVYIALNKPIDYISSASNEQGQTVLDLLNPENNVGKFKKLLTARVYPVGRLDKDSEGLSNLPTGYTRAVSSFLNFPTLFSGFNKSKTV